MPITTGKSLESESSKSLGNQMRKLNQMMKALSNDIQFSIGPTALAGTAGTLGAFSRTVTIKVTDSTGKVHDWCNYQVVSGISASLTTVATVAGQSTISLTGGNGATLNIVRGVATTVISATSGSWSAGDKAIVKVSKATIAGSTLATVKSTQTFA